MNNSMASTNTVAWRPLLNACLNGQGPTMVFQPIFSLEPQTLVGYEALSRFPSYPPNLWYEAAVEAGLSYELEMMAVRNAFRRLDDIPAPVYLAINISPANVVHPNFVSDTCRYDLSRVVLELTEHHAVQDYGVLQAVLDPLRKEHGAIVCTPVGVRSTEDRLEVSVDDLGAGFASMRHVFNLDPDYMKLDLDIVRNVDSSLPQRAFVAAMVTFGAKMGVQVVAEGVETESELVTLRALDVAAAQGYYLGRPGALP